MYAQTEINFEGSLWCTCMPVALMINLFIKISSKLGIAQSGFTIPWNHHFPNKNMDNTFACSLNQCYSIISLTIHACNNFIVVYEVPCCPSLASSVVIIILCVVFTGVRVVTCS